MGERTAAEVLVDCLLEQGVTTAFGVPGESYLAVLDALYDVQDRIRLIPNRHEGGAAFMAEAWAKLTGRPGICFVTRGPGATNAAIGVHTAMQASTPMLLFIGQVETVMRGREAFQEVDYRAFFGGVAKWAVEIETPERVAEIVGRAFATALSGRPGPVVVALPENVLTARVAARARPRVRVPEAAPAAEDVAELAALLEGAEAPLVIAGGSGWTEAARAGLARFAEANRLPVLAGPRCQDVLDNGSPSYAGDAGLGKLAYVKALMREADVILALNIRFGENTTDGYTLPALPMGGQALIHVHAGEGELGKIYPARLPIQANPTRMMAALGGLRLEGAARWAGRCEAARADYLASLDAPPQPGALDMGAVMAWLRETLPPDAIVANGAGNFAIWPNKHFSFRAQQRLLGPQSGAMGYGLPAAIAAKIARPQACVVCFTGDGDFQMTMAELGTAMQAGAQPIVLLVNNGAYGTIRMHQERHYPGRVSFTELQNPDFTAIARAYGFHAERVERTAEFAEAFGRAREAAGGAVLELMVPVEAITPRQTLSQIREAAKG